MWSCNEVLYLCYILMNRALCGVVMWYCTSKAASRTSGLGVVWSGGILRYSDNGYSLPGNKHTNIPENPSQHSSPCLGTLKSIEMTTREDGTNQENLTRACTRAPVLSPYYRYVLITFMDKCLIHTHSSTSLVRA